MNIRLFAALRVVVLVAIGAALPALRLGAETLVIDTVAGTGLAGYTGDGGPATSARLFALLRVEPI